MEAQNYSQLKGQLLILEQIKNPSPYIVEAIKQIRNELESLEAKDTIYYSINKATEEIEKIKKTFPDLNIIYSINAERPTKTEKIKEKLRVVEKSSINIVTHINAFNKNYTFKDPRSIIFQNKEYTGVKYWKDVLETVCNLMQEKHPDRINRILGIKGRKRLYFAYSLSQLNSEEAKNVPRKIKNTNIYMEHNFSANKHAEVCYKVIDLFGYKRSELNFITY